MKIFINDEEIKVFNGATVLDVLRSFYAHCNQKLPSVLPTVTDAYGNIVETDGELTEGNHLYI